MESTFPPEIISTTRTDLRKQDAAMAPLYFRKIERDRQRLKKFLPWAAGIMDIQHENVYLLKTSKDWETRTLFSWGIFLHGDGESADLVGSIGIHNIIWANDSCEIGYLVFTPYEGQGFISEALQALEKVLFEMGFNRLEIRCNVLNQRSVEICRRNNYVQEGVLRQQMWENGKLRDTMVFSKLRGEYISKD
ncbi:MAG: GNAT family protein [Pseudomonadota bacterium]